MAYSVASIGRETKEFDLGVQYRSLAAVALMGLAGWFSGAAIAQAQPDIPMALKGARLLQKIKRGADANPGFRIMGLKAGTDTEGLEQRI